MIAKLLNQILDFFYLLNGTLDLKMLQDRYIHLFEKKSERQNHCNTSKFRKSVPRDLIYWFFKKENHNFQNHLRVFIFLVLLAITRNISLKCPDSNLSTITCEKNRAPLLMCQKPKSAFISFK